MSKLPLDKRTEYVHSDTYWRSLEERSGSPEFEELATREFPSEAHLLKDPVSRRSFLQLMSASASLAGLAACRRPIENLLPYTHTPEGVIPGVAQHFASTFSLSGKSYGILVESHEGRPTKVEGNPEHPYSLGATDTYGQASVLGLYDPDRSTTPLYKGEKRSWDAFDAFAAPHFKALQDKQGAGLVIITETVTSPTVAALQDKLAQAMPKAQWFAWDPINDDNCLAGAELAFGQAVKAKYDLEAADVIASFGSDFLHHEDDGVRYCRAFAKRRKPEAGEMNRAYVVEATYSVTGAAADHRLRVQNRQIFSALQALANELFGNRGLAAPAGLNEGDLKSALSGAARHPFDADGPFIKALAADLVAHKGAAVVLVGAAQPAAAHALAQVINSALGAVGKTVSYSAAKAPKQQTVALATLPDALSQAETILVLGGNPVYNFPQDVKFEERWKKAAYSIHLSDRIDETSVHAAWHLPRSHYLEAWGDAQASDGTLSIVQPLIRPLYESKSDIEVLAMLAGNAKSGYELVRETWREGSNDLDAERAWRKHLASGMRAGSTNASVTPAFVSKATASFSAPIVTAQEYEVQFLAGQVYDGRFANNAWLQELPDPITKVVWDNAALVSPKTAKELGISAPTRDGDKQDVVKITVRGQSIDAAVWIVPGQADKTIGIALGYGRTRSGTISKDKIGFDAYPIRHSQALGFDAAQVAKTGGLYQLVSTQTQNTMADRPVVREGTLAEYKKEPRFAEEMVEHPPLESLWDEHTYGKGHQWGMSIDLSTCTGCNTCTIACQAENNIPVVGKDQTRRGRNMAWIRIDRYFAGKDENAPRVVHQPVGCQQCENAPCEQVCPVAATIHSPEGVNDMVYNRCIGTRYCSNNCPYKVRRFNFLAFHEGDQKNAEMQHNPNVTVRMRGVMEKCNYCTQRISAARIAEKVNNRPMRDGDFTSACAAACPAGAITFGDLNLKDSKASKLRKSPRAYAMLAELNTKPRTTYLARIGNPNPELLREGKEG